MLNPDEVQSPLVRAFLEQLDSDDDADPRALLRADGRDAEALLDEFQAALELAHELPLEEASDLRYAVADLATATGAPAAVALVLRDQVRRAEDDRLDDVTVAFEGDPGAWTAAAFDVRSEAVESDDEDLRRTCGSVLALAEPGTPGVLDALYEELDEDPFGVIHDLYGHGDPAASGVLLDWQRALPDFEELDDETMQAVYLAVRTALEWGAEVEQGDIERANAAAELTRDLLTSEIEDLEDELAAAKQALRDVQDLSASGSTLVHGSGFGHAVTGGVSRNAPCPCGSGRKTKKCCG